MEWQPIETAPKGGGAESVKDPNYVDAPKILLYFGEGVVSVAYWDWSFADGGHYCSDGFAWLEPCSGDALNMHYNDPTHWMPLPEPPF